ncbi:hypothetical protein GSY74_10435 [Sulfurovum sp. bin170]|uniref:hypothetical protein n=1 Tax=Sulfurovum sp. bin170 TaxID=2695268 RepID=UPI0013E0B385|nr:hypothetical protein [Sulfurovum sp. bin170]NEW61703.1 hypothetical protein [Sulfurovum sp. bin170]
MPNRSQLVPIFNSSHSIDYDLEFNLPTGLDKPSAQRTLNAWEEGTLVDGIGQVWIISDFLAQIWRTDASTASFFVGSILSHDKANFGGNNCIKYSAVIYRLNEIIQSPTSHKRREYLRVSENIGKAVRDSDPVEVIRLKYREFIEETKKKLKQQKIKQYNISFDELTDEPINNASSEFHHIRRQSIYPNMISLLWNGLIINQETHRIITQHSISDEYDLKDICKERGWNLNWFHDYQENLERYGF